jgi:hypothetical protein
MRRHAPEVEHSRRSLPSVRRPHWVKALHEWRCPATTALRTAMLILVTFAVAGCAGPSRSQSGPTTPADLSITLGEGGGFAGRYEGYMIGREGEVRSWSGQFPGENTLSYAGLSQAHLADLWDYLVTVRFFEIQLQQTGNLTAFIDLVADGRRHRISWVPREPAADTDSHRADQIYRHLLEVITGAAGSR